MDVLGPLSAVFPSLLAKFFDPQVVGVRLTLSAGRHVDAAGHIRDSPAFRMLVSLDACISAKIELN